MDLIELKDWLEKELRTEVPGFVWNRLVGDKYAKPGLSEVELKDSEFEAKKLVETFQEGAASSDGRRPPGREKLPDPPDSREVAVNLRPAETARARLLARLTAQMAAEHPDVISFREDVLGGQLLTNERACELVTLQGGPDGNGPIITALRELATRLSRAYRWRDIDTMWFVLTGHTPPIFPLHAVGSRSSSIYGPETATVTLIVEPWVNVSEVKKTYKELQAQMLGKDNNRPISERRLKLVEFVEEQKAEAGGWRLLMERWNKVHPEHEYSDVRNFSQAYKETYELLMYPGYNPPNWRPYMPTPAQDYRNEYRRREAETVFKEARIRGI